MTRQEDQLVQRLSQLPRRWTGPDPLDLWYTEYEKDAGIHNPDDDDSTFLHALVRQHAADGIADAITLLVEQLGADPSARDGSGRTPLLVLLESPGHRLDGDVLAAVRALLDCGAQASEADSAGGDTALHHLLRELRYSGLGDTGYCLVSLLIDRGADPSACNAAGESPRDIFDAWFDMTAVTSVTDRMDGLRSPAEEFTHFFR